MRNAKVSFKTKKFNCTEPKDYFINPICFGDDVGKWLIECFRQRRVTFEEDGPDQEDFGWYVNFSVSGKDYTVLIIFSEEERQWHFILEYNAGLIASLFGKRRRMVDAAAIDLIDEILKSEPEISEINWENV